MAIDEKISPLSSGNNQDDVDLVTNIIIGDKKSFRKLFDKYCESLLNHTLLYVKDPVVCEDITQHVWVNVWMNRKKLEPSYSIKSYLFKAVRNQSLKHLRDSKNNLDIENEIITLDSFEISPEEEFDNDEQKKLIQKEINKLPKKCKEIFVLNRIEGLSYNEISKTLNISINTVKTQMGRAFKHLRKMFQFSLFLL
jgi:RNA polymerase sigma-70 factor (ECF subfamily)